MLAFGGGDIYYPPVNGAPWWGYLSSYLFLTDFYTRMGPFITHKFCGRTDFRWIVEDLHRLDVPLLSVILIGRVLSRAARIAGDDLENPGRLFKIGFHTPETAAGEGGDPVFCIDLVHFFYLLLRGLPRCGYQHKKERRDIDKNSFHLILPEFGVRS